MSWSLTHCSGCGEMCLDTGGPEVYCEKCDPDGDPNLAPEEPALNKEGRKPRSGAKWWGKSVGNILKRYAPLEQPKINGSFLSKWEKVIKET